MGRSKKQPKKKYSQQQLYSALQEVKNGKSQYAASKKFGIPRSTLFNKITGKTLMGKKPGPNTVLLPEEECTIEKWVFALAVRGFPVTKRQLVRSVQLYLNINKRKTVFKNNLPGRRWYDSFRVRHPQISEKISQNLTIRRAAVTADKIRSWHSDVLKYCEEHELMDVLNDPARIFNMDEKGFILTPSKEVVLVKRGDKAVYNRSKNDEKECVTALLGGSASGKMTPPMMVHSYKRMPAAVLLNSPAKWSVGISDSGWQTQQTFHDYIVNIFYKWLLEEQIQLPVIVFIDGHKSHVSLTLSDFCAGHQIELIALYPNSTHLTQPMDVGVFKPLNTSWTNQAKDWRLNNQYAKIDKKDVAPVLEKAINSIKYSEHLTNAFKKCGLYPFNVENIDLSRVLPTISSSANGQEELWNYGPIESESNIVQVPNLDAKNSAVDRLTHFESLLGNCVLNSFRSSPNVWTGATEYSLLFTIWKQMYNEASQAIAAETPDPIILDVDGMFENTNEPGVEQFSIVDSDDGAWLLEGIDSSIIVQIDNNSIMSDTTISSRSECGNAIEDQCFSAVRPGIMSLEVDVHENAGPNVESNVEIIDGTISRTDEPLSAKENGSPGITAIDNADIRETDQTCNTFSPAAFKEAFFWPVGEGDKNKTKVVPKTTSVMTSEEWRELERRKFEEQQKQQAAKDGRKAAREAKKLEATKMAAEKLRLKNEKIAAAKEAVAKKLSEKRTQKNSQIRKRSCATKAVKNCKNK